MTRWVVTALVAAVALLGGDEALAQCEMCRQALVGSEQAVALARKLNVGIVFLLGAPFAVAATIGVAMSRARRSTIE